MRGVGSAECDGALCAIGMSMSPTLLRDPLLGIFMRVCAVVYGNEDRKKNARKKCTIFSMRTKKLHYVSPLM